MNGAYAYLRVSGAAQVSGHGLPRQREAIADYAKAHQYEIVEEFAELVPVFHIVDALDRGAEDPHTRLVKLHCEVVGNLSAH